MNQSNDDTMLILLAGYRSVGAAVSAFDAFAIDFKGRPTGRCTAPSRGREQPTPLQRPLGPPCHRR
jgi:hypothetical protein